MAVKQDNHRVSILFTQNQFKWIQKVAKNNKTSISKIVRWLISRTIANYISEDELKDMMRILKVNWIKKVDWEDDE